MNINCIESCKKESCMKKMYSGGIVSPGIYSRPKIPGLTGPLPSNESGLDWYNGGVLNKLQGRGVLSSVAKTLRKKAKGIISGAGKALLTKAKQKTIQHARKGLTNLVKQAKKKAIDELETVGKKRKRSNSKSSRPPKKPYITTRELNKIIQQPAPEEKKTQISLPKAITHVKHALKPKNVKISPTTQNIAKVHSKVNKLLKLPKKKLKKSHKKKISKILKRYQGMYNTAHKFLNRNNLLNYKF